MTTKKIPPPSFIIQNLKPRIPQDLPIKQRKLEEDSVEKNERQITKHYKYAGVLAADYTNGFTITTNRVSISENKLKVSRLLEVIHLSGISIIYTANPRTKDIWHDICMSHNISDIVTIDLKLELTKKCPHCRNPKCHRFWSIFGCRKEFKSFVKIIPH